MLFAKKLSYLPESAVQAGAGAVATLFHDAVMTPAEGLDTTRAELLKTCIKKNMCLLLIRFFIFFFFFYVFSYAVWSVSIF